MFQNIKVDVIYYKTNTDFEMEFNLCGCCRMRLLNDRVSDPKTFVNSLARAVSRSKVIIITGPLFGDEGITSLVAGALSTGTQIADSKTYGIEGEEEITILKGSTPLVTADGIFGGCIIESGPQTMILVSDGKNIRKNIMQSLIHPYIEELATGSAPKVVEETADETEEVITEEIETAPSVEETEAVIEETADEVVDTPEEEIEMELEEIADETVEENEEDEEIELEIPVEDEETEEDDDENVTLGSLLHTFKSEYEYSEEYQRAKEMSENSHDNAEEFIGYTGFEKPNEPINIPILIFAILLLLAIAILCYCLFYFPSKSGVEAISYIREIYHAIFG